MKFLMMKCGGQHEKDPEAKYSANAFAWMNVSVKWYCLFLIGFVGIHNYEGFYLDPNSKGDLCTIPVEIPHDWILILPTVQYAVHLETMLLLKYRHEHVYYRVQTRSSHDTLTGFEYALVKGNTITRVDTLCSSAVGHSHQSISIANYHWSFQIDDSISEWMTMPNTYRYCASECRVLSDSLNAHYDVVGAVEGKYVSVV